MDENYFEKLPPEEKERIGYIEDRPDLFETKILKIKTQEDEEDEKGNEKTELLVSTRDPGSGNAVLPVLKELIKDKGLQIDIITDGRAQEIIQNNFQTQDITPERIVLEAENVIGTPKAILIDVSSNIGIDAYVSLTFPGVPKILILDYYADLVEEFKEKNLPFPDKICVLDKKAKELLIESFPKLENIIEITGQPAFDKFAKENTEQLAREVKQKLGLKPTDKLVSFMSTMDELEKIKLLAETLEKINGSFYFAFRPHPRDNVSYKTYNKILTDANIKIVDTKKFSTNDIGAASDVVLTTWSTEGLHAIYRRKPSIHIIDTDFKIPSSIHLPPPPVELGASIGVNKVAEIEQILPLLLDTNSDLNKQLKEKMGEQYPADGKNTERVVNIIRQYLK